MSGAAIALVCLFCSLCVLSAHAEVKCGGPLNKVCERNDLFCCGNKPMKRPRVDEVGNSPVGLTESGCISYIVHTALRIPKDELSRRKKFVCPPKQFRQFNGDLFQPGGGVPLKRPEQRQRHVRPLASGLSWGLKGDNDFGYCTMGAILCSKTEKQKRWFVANKHCIRDDDLGETMEIFNAEAEASQYEVIQPSNSLQDKVDNARAPVPEVIGKVIFYYRKWVDFGDGYNMDISLIELDPKIPVRADVLVGDKPMKAMPVRGSMNLTEYGLLIPPKPPLCISGRSGGWGCFPVDQANAAEHDLQMAYPHDRAFGRENINPNFMYPGNSGSVFWKKEAVGNGYFAVGLFSGMYSLMPIDDVLNTIKEHTTHRLDLHVCTEESNTFSKKAGRAKKSKKQFLL